MMCNVIFRHDEQYIDTDASSITNFKAFMLAYSGTQAGD
jgi:hypothetical protein